MVRLTTLPYNSINLPRNSRVRFWALVIARAGYALRSRDDDDEIIKVIKKGDGNETNNSGYEKRFSEKCREVFYRHCGFIFIDNILPQPQRHQRPFHLGI